MVRTPYILNKKLSKYRRAKFSLPGNCLSKQERINTVIQLVQLWTDVLEFPYTPEVVIWKSMGAPLGCSSQGKRWTVFVNSNRVTANKVYINYAVLHEFSHMLFGQSEYKATRFALSIIKLNYNQDYFKLVCRAIKKRLTQKYYKSNPEEYLAYSKALRLVGA